MRPGAGRDRRAGRERGCGFTVFLAAASPDGAPGLLAQPEVGRGRLAGRSPRARVLLLLSAMFRRSEFAAIGWLAALSLVAAAVSADEPRVWRRAEIQRGVGDSAVLALAVDSPIGVPGAVAGAASLRLAIGGADGATLWRSRSRTRSGTGDGGDADRVVETRRLAQLERVHDLHFAQDGALWIATAGGLWRLDATASVAAAASTPPAGSAVSTLRTAQTPQAVETLQTGRLEDRSPGSGQAARFVHRVVSQSGVIVVATEAGAYATSDGRRWLRLNGDLPLGPIDALALRRAPESGGSQSLELWLVARGKIRRLTLSFSKPLGGTPHATRQLDRGSHPHLRVANSERVPAVSGLYAGASPLQIVLDWPDVDAALLYESAIAVRSKPGDSWQVVRPVLPPGAAAVWLARVGADYWLATDRGLMRAPHWRGPWRRAASPLGSAAVYRVAGAGDEVLAATGRGLFVGRSAKGELWGQLTSVSTATTAEGPSDWEAGSPRGPDPPVLAVQRAALRYLGLRAEHERDLRRDIRRRGWLPVLNARVAGAFDRDLAVEHDEAFLSGEIRHLYDRDWRQTRDWDASLSLTWDLGDIVYNPETIDLSREVRQLISLRDDVLDQINQAYYERQALLHALEIAPQRGPEAGAERRRLRLRADELAAGLDGWTGGWFGSQSGSQFPSPAGTEESPAAEDD